MLYFLIATANYEDSEVVRNRVKRVLVSTNLKEDMDFVLRDDFPTSSRLKDYLTKHELIGKNVPPNSPRFPHNDHVLVIAQPMLTDMDDAKPVLRQLINRDPNSVVLLLLNNAGVGRLRVKSERILKDLGAQSVDVKLREIVREFLRQHESFDYNRYHQILEEYRKLWLSPTQSNALHVDGATQPAPGDTDSEETTAQTIEAKWNELAERCLGLAENTILQAAGMFEQKHAASFGGNSANGVGGVAESGVEIDSADEGSGANYGDAPAAVASARTTIVPEPEFLGEGGATNAIKGSEARGEALLSLTCAYLFLWVEARLYSVRARSNYGVFESAKVTLVATHLPGDWGFAPRGFGVSRQERTNVRSEVRTILHDYRRKLSALDKKLDERAPGHAYFARKLSDAEQYRAWSEDFGPTEDMARIEPGWIIHAETIGRLLSMNYREALGREYWRDRGTWGSAFLNFLFWAVAGYGFAPGRTLLISFDLFLGSAMLQLVDDQLVSQCVNSLPNGAPIQGVGQRVLYYLQVSTANITSLGSVNPPCGYWHPLISAVESLSGYFLLAVLTTLFVQSILER